MQRVTLEDAQNHLSELITQLQPGEAIDIVSGQKVVARITAALQPERQPRQPGSAVGTFKIVADDKDYLADFQDYMP